MSFSSEFNEIDVLILFLTLPPVDMFEGVFKFALAEGGGDNCTSLDDE